APALAGVGQLDDVAVGAAVDEVLRLASLLVADRAAAGLGGLGLGADGGVAPLLAAVVELLDLVGGASGEEVVDLGEDEGGGRGGGLDGGVGVGADVLAAPALAGVGQLDDAAVGAAVDDVLRLEVVVGVGERVAGGLGRLGVGADGGVAPLLAVGAEQL